jgi:plastocyanin
MGRVLAVVAIASIITSCAGPQASALVRTDRVRIFDDPSKPETQWGYAPATIEVPIGTTVTFTNAGVVFHTVTADVGRLILPLPGAAPTRAAGRAFDEGADPGKSLTITFDQAGTWPYHCGIHPDMKGVVQVCDGACK